MVEIDDIIGKLINHPSKELFYSISEGKILERKVSGDEYESNEDLCCFCGAKKCWDTARRTFMGKHKDVFQEVLAQCKVASWNSLVKEANLEREWFKELRLALAENVTRFTEMFGLKETEAEPELYAEIKKELLSFEAKHYERKYCDMVYFRLGADYEVVPLTILGNAGKVFGISFYPSDAYGDNFLLIQNQESLGLDSATTNSISKMLSFYFEEEPNSYPLLKDPYESKQHITSAYLCYGTFMRSYLPKSLAIRALNYLEWANKEMALFAKSKQGKVKDGTFYDITLDDDKFGVYEIDPYGAFKGHLPYDFNDVPFPDVPLTFRKGGAFDATIKILPGFTSEEEEERVIGLNFIAIFCDHDSGYIHVHTVGQAKNFRPFDELVEALAKDLQKITLPKTIYVNNYLDLRFFRAYFEPYIEKGKVKVEIQLGELKTDVAYRGLKNFLENVAEKEEGFVSKRPAEA